MSLRMRNWIMAFVAALLFCNFAHADVITGTQQGNADTYVAAPSWAVPNQVVFSLSGDAPWGLWIYGSSYWGALPNDWAVASGVTDISQIVNASIYPLNNGYGEIFKDDFVVAEGDTGYWAVLKITNIRTTPRWNTTNTTTPTSGGGIRTMALGIFVPFPNPLPCSFLFLG